VVSGFGSGHVFLTTNAGAAWADISGDLPDVPVSALAVDFRAQTPILYAGTDLGVFASSDGGTQWHNYNANVFPNVPVTDLLLDVSINKMVASTYGRSMWVTNVTQPAALVPGTCTSVGTPLAIPDSNLAGVSHTRTVADAGTVADLSVCVEIDHTYVGDLSVELTHQQTGRTVRVIDRPGRGTSGLGCSRNNILAVLDDEAPLPVEDQCSTGTRAIIGTFSPNAPLSGFDGESRAGDWILKVIDSASQDTGVLRGWHLSFADGDADLDGCTDIEEGGPDEKFGGQRSSTDSWDFYDVTNDRRIDLSDTLAILEKFGVQPNTAGYDPLYDRYSPDVLAPWRTAFDPRGFGIDLTDALVNLASFGHDCS
jgi:subtilisin-like proprotein convertase family protein